MNEITMATDEQMASLEAIVSSLQAVEQALHGVMAARDGLLALASRLALSMAEEGGGVETSDITLRSVAAELAAVMKVSDRTVQRRMADAEFAVERFPQVWAAQGTGRIGPGHARVIVEAGAHLADPQARAAYAERVLEFAEDESPNRLRPIAQRLAEQYEPRSLDRRHEDAREKRSVWVTDQPDGMAELGVLGPAVLIHAAFERLTGMAKVLPQPDGAESPTIPSGDATSDRGEPAVHDDQRTLGQKRSDLALDLLLTGAPAGHDSKDGLLAAVTANVSVTVPVLTLIGVTGTESPAAELDGRSPIDPETARMLAGAASGWDRVLTHPIGGQMLAVDRYRPGEALRRRLRARDQRCRFPGCGMPSRENDLDHTVDAALGGATDEANLGTLCRRHHVLKHHSPWRVAQFGDGLLEWTSPTGRVYIDRPPPPNTVTFAEADQQSRPPRDLGDASGDLSDMSGDLRDMSGGPGSTPDDPGVPDDPGRPYISGASGASGMAGDSGGAPDPWAALPDELLAPF